MYYGVKGWAVIKKKRGKGKKERKEKIRKRDEYKFVWNTISFIIYRSNLAGQSDGGLDTRGIVNGGFEALLEKLTSDCNNANNLSTEYYGTDVPENIPTTSKDLVKLIKEFPSRLKDINDGQGVPIMVCIHSFLMAELL